MHHKQTHVILCLMAALMSLSSSIGLSSSLKTGLKYPHHSEAPIAAPETTALKSLCLHYFSRTKFLNILTSANGSASQLINNHPLSEALAVVVEVAASLQFPVVLGRSLTSTTLQGGHFLLVIEGVDLLLSSIGLFEWSPDTKFLVVFLDPFLEAESVIVPGRYRKILSDIWIIYKLMNILFYLRVNKKFRLIFYDPFKIKNTADYGDIMQHDDEQYMTALRVMNSRERNLRGYPISVAVIPSLTVTRNAGDKHSFSGLDMYIVRYIAERLNFTIKFQETGNYSGIQSVVNILQDLQNGTADLTGNCLVISEYSGFQGYFLSAVYHDRLCFIVPSQIATAKWVSPLLCFDLNVWCILFISYVFSFLTRVIIIRMMGYWVERNIQEDLLEISFGLIKVFTGSPYEKMHKIVWHSDRVILGTCLIISVTTVGAFQGRLVAQWQAEFPRRAVSSLEELASPSAPTPVAISLELQLALSRSTDPLVSRIAHRLRLVNASVHQVALRIANRGDVAMLLRKMDAKQELWEWRHGRRSQSGRGLQLLRDCVLGLNLSPAVAPRFPLLRQLRAASGALAQSGLAVREKLSTKLRRREQKRAERRLLRKRSSHRRVVFGFGHLQMPFFALGAGCLLAFLTWCLEWVLFSGFNVQL